MLRAFAARHWLHDSRTNPKRVAAEVSKSLVLHVYTTSRNQSKPKPTPTQITKTTRSNIDLYVTLRILLGGQEQANPTQTQAEFTKDIENKNDMSYGLRHCCRDQNNRK